jgi:hypothetical protein
VTPVSSVAPTPFPRNHIVTGPGAYIEGYLIINRIVFLFNNINFSLFNIRIKVYFTVTVYK